jgi:integrase
MGPQLRAVLEDVRATSVGNGAVFPFGSSREDRAQEILKEAVAELGGEVRDMLFFHALRHYFRTQHMRQGTPDRVRDALTGHSRGRRNAGDGYDHASMEDMRKAVAKVTL